MMDKIKAILRKPVLYGSVYSYGDAVVLLALLFLVTRC